MRNQCLVASSNRHTFITNKPLHYSNISSQCRNPLPRPMVPSERDNTTSLFPKVKSLLSRVRPLQGWVLMVFHLALEHHGATSHHCLIRCPGLTVCKSKIGLVSEQVLASPPISRPKSTSSNSDHSKSRSCISRHHRGRIWGKEQKWLGENPYFLLFWIHRKAVTCWIFAS